MDWKKQSHTGQTSLLLRLVLLALFFLGGIFLGQVLAGKVPDATGQELTEYLRGYVALEAGVTPQAMLSCLLYTSRNCVWLELPDQRLHVTADLI